jgi:hypothetical protein
VKEFYPKRIKGTKIFQVQVTYSTEVDVDANPLALPAAISIDSQPIAVPAFTDVDGFPLLNLAGDFIEGVERELTEQIIKIEKNIPINLPSWVDDYGDGVVNSDVVRVKGMTKLPGTLKLGAMSIGADQNVEPQTNSAIRKVPFVPASIELHWRRDGWSVVTPNRGFFELVPVPGTPGFVFKGIKPKDAGKSGKKPTKIRVRGVPFQYTRRRITVGDPPDYPAEPVPLDTNGMAVVNPTAADIVLLEFVMNQTKPFNVLPLK